MADPSAPTVLRTLRTKVDVCCPHVLVYSVSLLSLPFPLSILSFLHRQESIVHLIETPPLNGTVLREVDSQATRRINEIHKLDEIEKMSIFD